MRFGLDATYSLGSELSGVGVYSREILFGLAGAYPHEKFSWFYRPHRISRAWRESIPENCRRGLLCDSALVPSPGAVFHGLNQRLPSRRLRRSVTTFHDLFVLTGDYSTPEFRRRFSEQAREAAARADLIITVSQFTAEQVTELLNVERTRIRVIHHGVRMPNRSAAKREKIVLHVGAIQRRKNIVRLVQAFEQMPEDWLLVLAGSTGGFGAEEALDAVEQSTARTRIRLTGYLTAPELEALYSTASILAFPSLDEGFGIPVLEAMGYGLPVVTSDRSALPEVAGDAAALVDPTSADALANALVRVATNPAVWNDLATRGLQRAAMFTWGAAVRNTWGVYQELV